MIITNPTPITPQPFDRMWITSLLIQLPVDNAPGSLEAVLQPYDGAHLLAGGERVVRRTLPAEDQQTAAVLDALKAEVMRQHCDQDPPISIVVLAKDPAKPVSAVIKFNRRKYHRIPDCFALAATDQVFATVFVTAMAEIARLAGLDFALA